MAMRGASLSPVGAACGTDATTLSRRKVITCSPRVPCSSVACRRMRLSPSLSGTTASVVHGCPGRSSAPGFTVVAASPSRPALSSCRRYGLRTSSFRRASAVRRRLPGLGSSRLIVGGVATTTGADDVPQPVISNPGPPT